MNNMNEPTQNNNEFESGNILNTFISQLRAIAHPPIFMQNEEQTRRASILYSFLLTTLILSVIVSMFIPTTSTQPLLVFVLLLVIEIVMGLGLIAIRKGHVTYTAITITILFWAFIAAISLLYGNVLNPATPTFIVIIFIAGLTISGRAAFTTTILTILYSVIYLIAQNNLPLRGFIDIEPRNLVLLLAFDAGIAALLVIIANRTTNNALNDLSSAREDLLESNKELHEIQKYLQESVKERTDQLEKRNHYLQAASQVTKESLNTLDLQEMLENIAKLISNQFGFYHVGIFLNDDSNEFAVLSAVSSEGGKRMLARNHRLEIGKQGIVGFVTSIGQARISQDTDMDRIHTTTAELPETRSEMALPLKSRGKIIGALDIQDSKANAFQEEDTPILQTVADQIALAVENIRLYQQTQESLEEIRRVYGEYSQQAWSETYQKNQLRSYRYASGAIESIQIDENIEPDGKTVSIPIQIRGYNIGAIEISKGVEDNEWSDTDLKLLQTLSEQLGVALDSARLYNETQLRASTEQVIGQINSELWETLEINSILKTAAAKLREALSVPELTVRLAQPASGGNHNGNASSPNGAEENEIN